MKKLLSFALSIVMMFGIASTASALFESDKRISNSDTAAIRSFRTITDESLEQDGRLEEPLPMDNIKPTVNIVGDKLEVHFNGEVFTLDGTVLQSDTPTEFNAIADRCRGLLRSHSAVTGVFNDLLIHFTDEIPLAITWFDYYIDSNENFVFASPKDVATIEGSVAHTVAEISKSTYLSFGINQASVLSSTNEKINRCIRLVCGYENETVEYLMIIPAPALQSTL